MDITESKNNIELIQLVTPQPVTVIRPSPVVIVIPKTVEIIRITPSRLFTVVPPKRGAWDERGWTKQVKGDYEIYAGFYAARTEKFHGRIETDRRSGKISVFIYNPPSEIKNHPHGPCFQLVSDNWFQMHWQRAATNVDDAILYMEKVLDESLHNI